MKISKILLIRFRGASDVTEILLDPTKKMALIFGENGTGKSTIVDAIDIVSNNIVGSLKNLSLQSKYSHLATIGHDISETKISVHSNELHWDANISKSGVTIDGPSPKPNAHILRRSDIVRLVEAQPKQRYEQIAKFIDVGEIEASEQMLGKALKAQNQILDSCRSRKTRELETLNKLWEDTDRPDTNAGFKH